MPNSDLIDAHRFSSNHRETLEKDTICGCFHCLQIFFPSEIQVWIHDQSSETAICPHCGIDAVLGESSGYPIQKDFLQRMHKRWFFKE